MATEVDICNLALARLGDSATVASIDPPEGSPQAEHCARFYPIARDTLLDRHPWSFCTTRATLAQLSAAPTSGWQFSYALPSNALNILGLFESGSTDDSDPKNFEIETLPDGTEVIYSNTESAICRYTLHVTNPARFQPLFIETLSWLLASHLAGPVLKGDKGAGATLRCYQMFETQLARAIASDSAQRRVRPTHNVPWMQAR